MANLSFELVSVNGVVDMDASLAAAKTALDKFVLDKETEETSINDAVHAVFDTYVGTAIPMPALVSLVLTNLGSDPESYKTLGAKVTSFVRDRSGEKGSSVFSINKGRGGGVKRWSDCE